MKQIVLFLIFVAPFIVSAQAPQITSLYDQKSRIPKALIPFQVSGDSSVQNVTVTAPTNGKCKAMRDPYISSIFLLKCTEPASVRFSVTAAKGSQIYEITSGAIEVKQPFSGVIDTGSLPTDPESLPGAVLFRSYCIACHLQPASKKDRTAAVIKSAISNNSSMRASSDLKKLTDAQIQLIADYLKEL